MAAVAVDGRAGALAVDARRPREPTARASRRTCHAGHRALVDADQPASRTDARPRRARGCAPAGTVHWNLVAPELVEHAVRRGEGQLADMGPFVAVTAPHTGRSPNDKFVVQRAEHRSATSIGARSTSRSRRSSSTRCSPTCRRTSNGARRAVRAGPLLRRRSRRTGSRVRYVSPNAWHMAFVRNMFIRPELAELADVRAELHGAARARSSRPTRRGTARAPARSSCSTSRGA